MIFPLDGSVCILCKGFVPFFVLDIRQIRVILNCIAVAGIFQLCLYGDLSRIAFGIAFYIDRFCLVFFFGILFLGIIRSFGRFLCVRCLLGIFCLRSLRTVRESCL